MKDFSLFDVIVFYFSALAIAQVLIQVIFSERKDIDDEKPQRKKKKKRSSHDDERP